jgi:two-component system, OmpR family, response regulator MtrA
MIGFLPNAQGTATLPSRSLAQSALLHRLGRLSTSFASGLEAEGISTFASDSIEDAVSLSALHRPDLILISVAGPDGLGSLARDLLRQSPHASILALVESTDPSLAIRALEAGAHDVVSPPHTVATVLLRAHVLRRNATATRSREFVPLRLEARSRSIVDAEGMIPLTGREYDLLERLLSSKGQVVSREELLQDIWGAEQDSEAVLDATVHRLRKKLERDPASPEILTTVRGVGYRLEASRVEPVPA